MTQAHVDTRGAARRLSLPLEGDDMVALLRAKTPQTDSEAFQVLRRSFPASPLCDRVAAISRWRVDGTQSAIGTKA
ncbi:hypothetical protein [Phreatobacter stygius]|uniref:Uncharacterized protein n=1 Tax=Phreatobacter stygius TaxID=1940610 RepID=A0A4D7BG79_9HYPH|nr:hypothetical protein [Phreatobacter stygius]QCI68788.1 hypothetical protein E8M01_33870 [Phreatobacter stygius]